MAKNEAIKTGLDTLFGGSKSNEPNEEQVQHKEQDKAESVKVEPTTEEEEDELMNSIEDEALREKLRERRDLLRETNRTKSAKYTPAEGYSRTSLIINNKKYAKIKEIAFRSTLTTKVVVETAMDMLIEKYEEKHGTVIPNPKNYKGDVKDLFK